VSNFRRLPVSSGARGGPGLSVALVTSTSWPHGHPNDEPLAQLLDADWIAWDDESIDWSSYDLAVVRSVWDYPLRRPAFLSWSRSVRSLVNPPSIFAWNTDKSYLRDLQRAGLLTVPTEYIPPGRPLRPRQADFVIKPAVSLGGIDCARFGPDEHDRAVAHLAAIHASFRTALVQPYLASVEREGELNVVYLDGEYSHAVRKEPMLFAGAPPLSDQSGSFAVSAKLPSSGERALADRAVSWLQSRFGRLAYARVDLMRGASGAPLITEVEAADPMLSLRTAPGAVERFAAILLSCIRRSRRLERAAVPRSA
jgi:hypothetical protein